MCYGIAKRSSPARPETAFVSHRMILPRGDAGTKQ
jgi:hypothetical protein